MKEQRPLRKVEFLRNLLSSMGCKNGQEQKSFFQHPTPFISTNMQTVCYSETIPLILAKLVLKRRRHLIQVEKRKMGVNQSNQYILNPLLVFSPFSFPPPPSQNKVLHSEYACLLPFLQNCLSQLGIIVECLKKGQVLGSSGMGRVAQSIGSKGGYQV